MVFVVVLGLAMGLLFFNSLVWDLKAWKRKNNGKIKWSRSSIASSFYYMIGIIMASLMFVNLADPFDAIFSHNFEFLAISSVILSFLISFFWFRYLWWIDIFEREGIREIIILFALSCFFTLLVLPTSEAIQVYLDFHLNGEVFNDLMYCILGIGLVEETAKIIPFLILLRFSKVINEPFDYILYGSICALGFAFVENILYLYSTELDSLHGRSLFASVSHMINTSIITYGMALKKFGHHKSLWNNFFVLVIIASLSHGFYDFWLINPIASKLYLVTFIYLMIMIKVWMTMKNNLLNISPYFRYDVKLKSSSFKYRLLNALLTVSYLAYILMFLYGGAEMANHFLIYSVLNYMFILLFMSINFSNFNVIRNYIAPFKIGKNPLEIFLPHLEGAENLVGMKLELRIVKKDRKTQEPNPFSENFPLQGMLIRRMVYKQDTNWYLFEADYENDFADFHKRWFIVRTRSRKDDLDFENWQPIRFMALWESPNLDKPTLDPKISYRIDNIFSKPIVENVEANE